MTRLLDRNLRDFFNPKYWLVIVCVPHTLFSALVPLSQSEVGSDTFTNATFGLLNTVVLVAIFGIVLIFTLGPTAVTTFSSALLLLVPCNNY